MNESRWPQGLLVSVRDADEAELAVTAGAAIIDVKEPTHGSLGRADVAVAAAVIAQVAGRAPVTLAGGELAAGPDQIVAHLAEQGTALPAYVEKEFEAYLKCGRLEHGFLRVRCESCHLERLVAFSPV